MNYITASQLFATMNSFKSGDYLFGVDFELNQAFFIPNPTTADDILWRVGDHSNFTANHNLSIGTHFEPHPLSLAEYEQMFGIVRCGLLKGNSFLTNLTVKTPLTTDYTLSEIAMRCNSPYLLMIPNQFVCFSPEIFIRIDENGVISSNPMKGTIDATIPDALQKLIDDPKEVAEHNTIVDLIRNDLSIVADTVRVEQFRYADSLTTSSGEIIQTSSLISGRLRDEYRDKMGDVLSNLLPAGSVSGAPKRATLKIIRDSETIARGFYCGVFGYCGSEGLDAAVMIRYIEQDGKGGKYFRSGSGVTANSSMVSEYNEIIKKIYLPFSSK